MKQTKLMALFIMAMLCLSSCGDDESDYTPSSNTSLNYYSLFGTWYGERSNAHQSINITFRENKTGQFIYESNVYYRVAEFTYSISGNKIICQGTIVGEDGVANNWNQTFEWHDSYLAPLNAYTGIYLYKNGEIPDDNNSNQNESGNNGSPNGYEPVYALGFGIESAEHFKNGIYQYMIGASAQYPADAWKNDITSIGFAIDVTNGTLNEYGLKKMDVDRHTWLCLWQSYSDNKAHNFGTTFFVTSREPRVIIEYLPFYDKNNSRISLNWENITLTPTNIREINANY